MFSTLKHYSSPFKQEQVTTEQNVNHSGLVNTWTSIQLKLNVILGVCNYVIFLLTFWYRPIIVCRVTSFPPSSYRNRMLNLPDHSPKFVCIIIKNVKICVQNHQKFVCGIIKITIFDKCSMQKWRQRDKWPCAAIFANFEL